MAKYFGSTGRFELYSIVIEKLDDARKKDVEHIYFHRAKFRLLYKRPDGEAIPTGVPLLLKFPKKNTVAYDTISIIFGEYPSDWMCAVLSRADPIKEYNKVLTLHSRDAASNSSAKISYELILEAVEARVQFQLEDSQGRRITIQIIKGEIAAYTGKVDVSRRRLLRHFGHFEAADEEVMRKRHDAFVLPRGDTIPLPLDRPVIALPLNGQLRVEVDLTCAVSSSSSEDNKITPEDDRVFIIKGSQVLDVPDHAHTDYTHFSANLEGLKLNMKVVWFDSILTRRLHEISDSD